MKLLKSFVILLVVLVLGIIVYFFVYKSEIRKKEKAKYETQLVRFDLDSIKSFTLVRPDSSIVFERGIGRVWNIVSPFKSEAYKDEMYNLFAKLNNTKILITVDDEPKDLSVYGLSAPRYYMAMNYDDGTQDTLFVGNDTPDSTMAYFRFASEERVLAIDNGLKVQIQYPARTYRARTILNVVDNDITSLDIQRSDTDRVFMISTESAWLMKHPWDLEGDNENMRKLIKLICDTQKTTLIEEKTDDLSQYGLDNPSLIFTITLKFGMPNKMILIGKKMDKVGFKNLWYAKEFDYDLIFTLKDDLIVELTRIPEWFIKKNPMDYDREVLTKIVLEAGNNTITFMKDAQRNWSVVSPVDKNMSQETMNMIFGCSRFLLINRLFAFKPTQQEIVKAGLDNPKIRMTFFSNDAVMDTVEFGNSFVTDNPNTYFRTSKLPSIFITQSTVNSDINTILEKVFSDDTQ